uniref:Sox C-terminal domain-containing protein n=1 Tax=Nothoprocta perdicaria TaxID=30464 RepID=A0A8C6YR78_NOTPE
FAAPGAAGGRGEKWTGVRRSAMSTRSGAPWAGGPSPPPEAPSLREPLEPLAHDELLGEVERAEFEQYLRFACKAELGLPFAGHEALAAPDGAGPVSAAVSDASSAVYYCGYPDV